jgi:sec-independent protein translocase protein TatA
MDSPAEILIIIAVALVLLGPSRIPQLARSLGEAVREFRSAGEASAEPATESADADAPTAAVTDVARPDVGT